MGLWQFASEMIRTSPCLANSARIYELLYYAVNGYTCLIEYGGGYFTDANVVEEILQNGADPNLNCYESSRNTPWLVYWGSLEFPIWHHLATLKNEAVSPFAQFLLPMEAMVKHGADVNAKVNLLGDMF